MDSKVEELEELEQERAEGDSDDEYTEDLRKELGEDMVKVKSCLDSHSEFSHNLELMANYMMDIRPGVPEANKLRSDAKQALDKSIKDEETIEKKVKDWKAKNRKWLRQRKKDKNKEKVDQVKTTENNSVNARWMENFARDLKPDKNLKKDGDLRAMKQWKQSMITYTGYIRKSFDLTPELYFDVFSNLCDQDMRKKLESIKGIREMGEDKIWDIIEGIWKETNPPISGDSRP